jgi:hypothetical protein
MYYKEDNSNFTAEQATCVSFLGLLYDKVPQVKWLKNQIYHLTVLEAEYLKSTYQQSQISLKPA